MSDSRRWWSSALNRWARRRHGRQLSPVTLSSNRIYILPSKSGVVFAVMLLIMLLGSMNYNNSMGLGLSFLLGSVALVAMHHCHRNLLGLRMTYTEPEAVFAGQPAKFAVALHNDDAAERSDLTVGLNEDPSTAINLDARREERVTLAVATAHRGYLKAPRLSIRTGYPGGLFRAWSWLYWDTAVLVYPKARGEQPLPVAGYAQDDGEQRRVRGGEDLAELKTWVPGEPLNRVAWKHHARTGDMHSKWFDEPQSRDLWLDWQAVNHADPEARLEQLAAWVVQSHEQGRRFGLRLAHQTIPPDRGDAHRSRCLRELALHP